MVSGLLVLSALRVGPRAALAAAGFETLEAGDIVVRHEQGLPIAGHLFIARKS